MSCPSPGTRKIESGPNAPVSRVSCIAQRSATAICARFFEGQPDVQVPKHAEEKQLGRTVTARPRPQAACVLDGTAQYSSEEMRSTLRAAHRKTRLVERQRNGPRRNCPARVHHLKHARDEFVFPAVVSEHVVSGWCALVRAPRQGVRINLFEQAHEHFAATSSNANHALDDPRTLRTAVIPRIAAASIADPVGMTTTRSATRLVLGSTSPACG